MTLDNDLVRILLEIQKDVAETKEAVQSLAGPTGRVTVLERSQDFQKWYTYAIVPVLAIARQLAKHFGL